MKRYETRLAPLLAAVLAMAPVAPASAASCWTPDLAVATTGYGEAVSLPKFGRLRAAAAAAEDLLRVDPVLGGIDGFRLQLRRTLNRDQAHTGADTAEVWLRFHGPDTWAGTGCTVAQGRADYFNTLAVELRLNDVSPLVGAAAVPEGEDEPWVIAMEPGAVELYRRTGVIRGVNDGVRGFRADGKPVLLPLSVGQHLDVWEKRLAALQDEPGGEFLAPQLEALRRHRAGLSATERGAQVQLPGEDGNQMWAYSPPGHAYSTPIYQLDPALLAPAADPGAVRLLTVGWYGPPDGGQESETLARWVAGFSPADAERLFAAGTRP